MDNLKDKTDTKNGFASGGRRIAGGLTDALRAWRERGGVPLAVDLFVLTIALLLSRCHVIFGSHPLGLALIAVLPNRVWAATAGAVIGGLTMGVDGLIYAVASAIILFLRVIISGGNRGGEELFSENLLLRMCSSVIGGFICGVYEILLSGLSSAGLLYGLSMVLLPPLLTFALSGAFTSGIPLRELIVSHRELLSLSGKSDGERLNLIFFQGSALLFLFFIALSLKEIGIFGISFSYIFVSVSTLLISRRFGALRGLAAGFLSSLGVSGVYSVSFGLAGLISGLLFEFGIGYGMLGGVMALSAWSAYSAGMGGFLATLPEYMMGAAISLPLLRSLHAPKKEETCEDLRDTASEMVGTMSLSYKNRYAGALDALEVSLVSLAGVIRDRAPESAELCAEDYARIVRRVADDHSSGCSQRELCIREEVCTLKERADALGEILYTGRRLSSEDINTDTKFCAMAHLIAEEINRSAAAEERERYRRLIADGTAEEYELIANLINEARCRDDAERAQSPHLTSAAQELVDRIGPSEASVKIFGERKNHVILAGEDADGSLITSSELRSGLESILGARLGTPEYFRKGSIALMECDVARSYAVEYAVASRAGGGDEVSGDTARGFETADGRFYALISDGMGRGQKAKSTSEFVTGFLERALDFGATKETVLHLLNHSLRRGGEECSATVDLFELDLLRGEALFLKSGAATSYIKRDGSIFRIRSETAPIGLMKGIDTERVRVEIKSGDYVIMTSDGIGQGVEDSTKLIQHISKLRESSPQMLAEAILSRSDQATRDDATVLVTKVVKV